MLADIVPETRKIDFGSGFELRGLGTSDFAYLFKYHLESLRGFLKDIESVGDVRISEGIIELFPDFISAVIALSAGEIEAVENAKKLPVGVQLEAFNATWELTFPRGDEEETEHIKKTWTTLARMYQMSSSPTQP